MDPLTRYIAEEIAEDHNAGRLTRREALRRLGLMGFGAVTASSVLASCSTDGGSGPDAAATTTVAPPPAAGRSAPVTDITFPGKGTSLNGVLAPAQSPRGAVLVIHEIFGISPFIRSVVGRLAGDGFTALAVDLLSRAGGTAAVPEAEAGATLRSLSEFYVADMSVALDELGRRQPGAKLGMCGFCFGGTATWMLLEAGEPRLRAAIPCYGTPGSENPSFTRSAQAAVLAIYASQDQRVNATREAARSALERDRLTHEIRTFPDVGHGFIRFFEDAANPSAGQAQAAYARMVEWFGRHLA